MKDDAEKLSLLKEHLAEGLSQVERGEYSGRSVSEITREVIAEGRGTPPKSSPRPVDPSLSRPRR